MLVDPRLTQAVSGILLRSERQTDLDVLERSYVDTGVLPQLDNRNNQVLYGRRGTGKSHVLRVLSARYSQMWNQLAFYVDVRSLGSAQQFADAERPLTQRCITLFKDFLLRIHDELLSVGADPEVEATGDALTKIVDFHDVITEVAHVAKEGSLTAERSMEQRDSGHLELKTSLKDLGVSYSGDVGDSSSQRISATYKQVFESNVVFAQVNALIDEALSALGVTSLMILIDEWHEIPMDVQPHFAEFLKRTFFFSPRITVKIASLEYRSRFSTPFRDNNLIGFELGSDITANLDLDDYYVYDRNPDAVADMFEQILYRHLTTQIDTDYLVDILMVRSATDLRVKLFTERRTFVELARASEGVVRDFIHIFNKAYFEARRRHRSQIDMQAVREAARVWYETDKATNLDDRQQRVLDRLITEVIGERRARSFMLLRSHASHPMIQSLVDARVVHLILRGYSDKENPGLRYNVYTLDYGTYVDLIHTKRQPEFDFCEFFDEPDRIVPFDDKRSIRRIILGPDMLGAHSRQSRTLRALPPSV